MIHLQPLYVTVTKNFSWENIASDNYIPLVYQYSYGDTSGNNSINSAIMALLCSKNDTFEDVADAVYPVQILYFLCVNYVYTDVNKISSYTAREIINDYMIDYDMFSAEEIIKIISFMHLVEETKRKKINKELLISKYNEYRSILNNKSLEKQYDKMLLKKSGVSIYQVMKDIIN